MENYRQIIGQPLVAVVIVGPQDHVGDRFENGDRPSPDAIGKTVRIGGGQSDWARTSDGVLEVHRNKLPTVKVRRKAVSESVIGLIDGAISKNPWLIESSVNRPSGCIDTEAVSLAGEKLDRDRQDRLLPVTRCADYALAGQEGPRIRPNGNLRPKIMAHASDQNIGIWCEAIPDGVIAAPAVAVHDVPQDIIGSGAAALAATQEDGAGEVRHRRVESVLCGNGDGEWDV